MIQKFIYFICFLLISLAAQAQTTLLSENFGTTGTLPVGWTTSGTDWQIDNTSPSSGYTGASGSYGMVATANSVFASSNLEYSNSFSTAGYENITVQWGAKLDNFDGSISFAYSVNGGAYSSVSFTNVSNNNTWALIPSIALPAEAAGASDLRFRIVAFSIGGGGTYSVDDFVVTGTAITGSVYYDLRSDQGGNPGALENTANWTNTADGTSGSTPPNFTSTDNQFIIKNNASTSISSNWTLGAGVSLSIGDGSTSVTFTVPSTASLSGGDISVLNSATLDIQNTSVPNIVSTSDASTVVYGASGSQTVTPRTYGNLTISGTGIKSLPTSASTYVNGVLTLSTSSDELALADKQSASLVLRGDLQGSGFIRGATSGVLIVSGSSGAFGTLRFSGVGTPSIARLSVERTGLTVNLASNIVINQLSLTSSTLNVGTSTVYVNSTGTISSGTIASSASGTVRYHSSTAGQIVVPGTYGNLRFFNANKDFVDGQTYIVLSTFAPGTTTAVTPLDYTMSFQGTNQVIPAYNYDNVIIGTGSASTAQAISIAGDLTADGSFTSTGTVTFNGSATQTISGAGTVALYDVTANQSVTNNAGINLTGILTLGSSVTFDADGTGAGTFTLISNTTGDAAIAAIPSGSSVSGTVTYQRYFTASDVWMNFGIPVSGATVADLQDDFPISGTFTGASTGSGIGTNPSMYYYNETVTGDVNQGWVSHPGTSNTESVSATRGYSAWMRSEYTGSGATIDVAGTINQGNVNLGVTYTSTPDAGDGYNLVNNPYPAAIDWNSPSWTKTNIAGVASVWDGASGVYQYSGGGGWDGIAASGQAFWVQTTGSSPALIATENVKTTASRDPAYYRTTEEIVEKLIISVTDDSENTDKAYLYFSEETATVGFDSQWDAYKLSNDIHNVSTLTPDGDNLALNYTPLNDCNVILPIKLNNVSSSIYTMNFDGLTSIPVEQIIFRDKYLGTVVNLKEVADPITFDINESDASSYGSDRFEIEFIATVIDQAIDYTPSVVSECEDYVQLNLQNTQTGITYEILNESLNPISNAEFSYGGEVEFFIQRTHLSEGLNTFSLRASGKAGCTSEFISEDIVTHDVKARYTIESVTNATICQEATATLKASGAGADGFYRWYETVDGSQFISGETSAEFTTPILSATTSYYVSAVNAEGCESERVAVVAEFKELNTPQTIGGNTCGEGSVILSASGAQEGDVYRWYATLDDTVPLDEVISDEFTTPSINSSRNFYVTIANAAGCESDKIAAFAEVIAPEKPTISVNNYILEASAGDAYQWYRDNEVIEGASGKTYVASMSGNYSVEVLLNTCMVKSDGIALRITGMNELSEIGVNVFPNPVVSTLTITASEFNNVKFELYNSSGVKILDNRDFTLVDNLNYSVDLKEFESGMYILIIHESNRVIPVRIHKE